MLEPKICKQCGMEFTPGSRWRVWPSGRRASRPIRNSYCHKSCRTKAKEEHARRARRAEKNVKLMKRVEFLRKSGLAVCHYTPETRHDLDNMISILHRKGHFATKESEIGKYGYAIEATEDGSLPSLFWVDSSPHPLSDDGVVCSSKEFQRFCHDLEQKIEKEGAHFAPFKKLQARTKTRKATAGGTMGRKEGGGIAEGEVVAAL